jgi:peptidyl-prolyl cis-trans isomerase A (cyclophilin A)
MMSLRLALRTALIPALLPTLALAQTPMATPPANTAPVPATQPVGIVRVALTTSMGVITLDLETRRAPITATNFLRYVDQKRFDGVTIYRAMKLGDNQGLIQGGPSGDPKRVLKPIAHEPTTKTGLKHVAGAISMARWAPGTATADFSILASPMPALDADPAATGDNAGYAVFGNVASGMDVVIKILNAPTSTTKGLGVMKRQMIAAPVKIITVRRVRMPPIAPRGT